MGLLESVEYGMLNHGSTSMALRTGIIMRGIAS